MYKFFDMISHNASRVARPETAPLLRHAASIGAPVRSESRFAKSASRAMLPLVKANPMLRTSMPSRFDHATNPVGLLNVGRLGGVRAYSDRLPPTRLIALYKPVLEEIVAHHDAVVELVGHGNYSIASFVEIALDIIPGVSSIKLDNGYSILGIQETPRVKNTSARMYDLKVMPPENPSGKKRKPFVLPITVYKADVLKSATPRELKMLLGLCSVAVNIHLGSSARKPNGSINIFSPTIPELGKLFVCVNTVKELISCGHVSTPTQLLGTIASQLKSADIDPKSKFVPPLKSILIETFNDEYAGYDLEIQRMLIEERQPKPALFRHEISHKGGAFRAAMKLNALALGNPRAGFSASCVTGSAESGEQSFTIFYHPSGVWLEQKNNPQTGQLQNEVFAKSPQLSEALKQRGVQAIISELLGML